MPRMIVLTAALLVGQAVALVQPAALVCAASCADDGPDGGCPPGCTACPCCPHPAPLVAPQHEGRPASVARWPVRGLAEATPVPPDPREIFHVPRRLPA